MAAGQTTQPPGQQGRSWPWRKIAGGACIALGLPGVLLPILPGIPLLIAGFALLARDARPTRSTASIVPPTPPADGKQENPPTNSDKRSYMRRRT